MNAQTILVVLTLAFSLSARSQDIHLSFSATGEATLIDSIVATNLRTGQHITLPGDGTLVLTDNSGIPPLDELTDGLLFYPNPFPGRAHFLATATKPQPILLEVRDLAGRLVARAKQEVMEGSHLFELLTGESGIYVVSLTAGDQTHSTRVISTGMSTSGSRIVYLGIMADNPRPNAPAGAKGSPGGYVLGYAPGDVVRLQGYAGDLSTILVHKPIASQNIELIFASFTDRGGRTYPVVQIGQQLWMAENLAWLPEVSPPTFGGYQEKIYYVQGYLGTDPVEAAGLDSYAQYGVLYNRKAADGACPNGWHLPGDGDWQELEGSLGMDEEEIEETGLRSSGSIGKKLKTTSGWSNDGNGDGTSGFNAAPAGNRNREGGFGTTGLSASFWTSSAAGSSVNFTRVIVHDNDGINRGTASHNIGLSIRCVRD